MSMRQVALYWEQGGGSSVYVPDRLKIVCPKCNAEIGSKDTILSIVHRPFYIESEERTVDELKLVVLCKACGESDAAPIVVQS